MANISNIVTKEQARAYVANRNTQATLCQAFDFEREFSVPANTTQTFEIPIGNEGDLEILGYNIEYDKASDDKEKLYLQFSQERGNRKWSNDRLPIRNIATPGVRDLTNPPARYGFRQFMGWAPANDKIKIEAVNTSTTEALRVCVTLHGILWFK
jgi:hypothetical protein